MIAETTRLSPRAQQTRRLLETMLDYLPSPRTSSGTLASSSSQGAAPSGIVRCGRCEGTGRVSGWGGDAFPCRACKASTRPGRGLPGHDCQPCLLCEGTGEHRTRRKGEATIDPYTGQAVNDEETLYDTALRASSLREIEQQLERMTRGPESAEFSWERDKRTYNREGSYRCVEEVLGWLRQHYPRRHALVWSVLVCAEPVTLGPAAAVELDATLEHLAAMMPDPIRVPWWLEPGAVHSTPGKGRWANGAAQLGRDASIRQAAGSGRSVPQLAARFGLSKRRVQQILAVDSRELLGPMMAASGM